MNCATFRFKIVGDVQHYQPRENTLLPALRALTMLHVYPSMVYPHTSAMRTRRTSHIRHNFLIRAVPTWYKFMIVTYHHPISLSIITSCSPLQVPLPARTNSVLDIR